jgi:hypothetical protein
MAGKPLAAGILLQRLEKVRHHLQDGMAELIHQKPPNVEGAKWSLGLADKALLDLIEDAGGRVVRE